MLLELVSSRHCLLWKEPCYLLASYIHSIIEFAKFTTTQENRAPCIRNTGSMILEDLGGYKI